MLEHSLAVACILFFAVGFVIDQDPALVASFLLMRFDSLPLICSVADVNLAVHWAFQHINIEHGRSPELAG